MAVKFIPGSITAAATPIKLLDAIPAQGATVVITNGSSADPIYLGSNNTVTAANGAVIPPYGIVTLHNVTDGQVWAMVPSTPAPTLPIPVGVIYGDNQ